MKPSPTKPVGWMRLVVMAGEMEVGVGEFFGGGGAEMGGSEARPYKLMRDVHYCFKSGFGAGQICCFELFTLLRLSKQIVLLRIAPMM